MDDTPVLKPPATGRFYYFDRVFDYCLCPRFSPLFTGHPFFLTDARILFFIPDSPLCQPRFWNSPASFFLLFPETGHTASSFGIFG
jgi:hypothetical protein